MFSDGGRDVSLSGHAHWHVTGTCEGMHVLCLRMQPAEDINTAYTVVTLLVYGMHQAAAHVICCIPALLVGGAGQNDLVAGL